jgi:hypothetical protein
VSVAERLRAPTPTRRWGGVGAAALVWFALYAVNLPFWDWVVYDLAGLAPASRLGSGVQFFFYDSIKIALLLIGIIFLVTAGKRVIPRLDHCPAAGRGEAQTSASSDELTVEIHGSASW